MKVKLQYGKLKGTSMLSSTTISNYIESIPPVPKIVKRCSEALNSGDMVLAADIANEDRALIHYLQNIVNKPIFGFRDEIKNARQIFGILGIYKAKQLIYSYYLLLLLPSEWKVFKFNNIKFQDFQARLIFNWGKIVQEIKSEDDEIIPAVSIIPASLIVCEMLFRDIHSTVKLLRNTKQLSYEKILLKMTGRTFFDISSLVAKKWEFSEKTVNFIEKLGDKNIGDSDEHFSEIIYLRLLLIYELSRQVMVQSELSDLFEVEPVFDDEITENFYKIVQE
jgi:HD-like signal output (HDOD) protein